MQHTHTHTRWADERKFGSFISMNYSYANSFVNMGCVCVYMMAVGSIVHGYVFVQMIYTLAG